MNIPNFLTLLRIVMIPLFIILLTYEHYRIALMLFVGAAVTDALDGFFARTFKQKTTLGAYLDPIADKLLMASSFATFSILKLIPAWLTILVLSRDVIIVLGILILQVNAFQFEIRPTLISKCTTVFQILSLGLALSVHILQEKYLAMDVIYWTTGILTITSGLHYITRGFKIIGEKGEKFNLS